MFETTNETKNYIIIFLLILTFFSLLGINLLNEAGDGFQWATSGIVPYIKKVLGIIGWSTGSMINVSTDIVSDTARAGIDVAEGSIQSVGNLLQSASKGGMSIDLSENQKLLNDGVRGSSQSTGQQSAQQQPAQQQSAQQQPRQSEIKKDQSSNSIQNPISNKKSSTKWCLVGEYQGKRGCIEVNDDDICISEKIYNNLGECINRPSI